MPWFFMLPGHHNHTIDPWTCNISVLFNGRKCGYILLFPEINSACKELISQPVGLVKISPGCLVQQGCMVTPVVITELGPIYLCMLSSMLALGKTHWSWSPVYAFIVWHMLHLCGSQSSQLGCGARASAATVLRGAYSMLQGMSSAL